MYGTTRALPPRPTLFLSVAALLLLMAAPAKAAPADPTLAVLNGAGLEAILFSPALAQQAAIDGPSAQGTVIAECCNGTTVTCEGSSGHFADADCDNGERGFCQTDEETKYCPDCSWQECSDCSTEPRCTDKHGTPCSPIGADIPCSFSDDTCGSCSCDFDSTWICTF